MVRFGLIMLACLAACSGSTQASDLPAPSVTAIIEDATTGKTVCTHTSTAAPFQAECSSNGVDAFATAAGGGTASVNSFATGYWGEAIVNYYIEVTGPSGVLVPVVVEGSASVALTGAATGFATLFQEHFEPDCTGIPNCTTQDGNYSLSVNLNSEQVTLVALFATAGRGIGTAIIDPQFTIDPTFARASEFQILVSPGVAPAGASAPEPGFSLILLAVLIYWIQRTRQSHAPEP